MNYSHNPLIMFSSYCLYLLFQSPMISEWGINCSVFKITVLQKLCALYGVANLGYLEKDKFGKHRLIGSLQNTN